MPDPQKLRSKAERCRQLAALAGDEEIERQLNALADEYDAKAMTESADRSEDPKP